MGPGPPAAPHPPILTAEDWAGNGAADAAAKRALVPLLPPPAVAAAAAQRRAMHVAWAKVVAAVQAAAIGWYRHGSPAGGAGNDAEDGGGHDAGVGSGGLRPSQDGGGGGSGPGLTGPCVMGRAAKRRVAVAPLRILRAPPPGRGWEALRDSAPPVGCHALRWGRGVEPPQLYCGRCHRRVPTLRRWNTLAYSRCAAHAPGTGVTYPVQQHEVVPVGVQG